MFMCLCLSGHIFALSEYMYLWKLEEVIRSPEAKVIDRYRCWDPNLGPLQEHLVLLTTEPSFQTQRYTLNQVKKKSESGFVSLHMIFSTIC